MSDIPTALSAKRLRACREHARETLEQVGRLTGVNKSTVLRWERGETAKINLPTLQLLAAHYHVSPRWLMGMEEQNEVPALREPPPVSACAVPLLAPPYTPDLLLDTAPVDTRRVPDAANCFWMRVTEDSMAPTFLQDDWLLIRRTPQIENGRYALVALGETNLVRRLVQGEGWIELQSDNPYYPARRISLEETADAPSALSILGAVLECRRFF